MFYPSKKTRRYRIGQKTSHATVLISKISTDKLGLGDGEGGEGAVLFQPLFKAGFWTDI